jgi:diguanylate cyclase (GGDEF)-like protein
MSKDRRTIEAYVAAVSVAGFALFTFLMVRDGLEAVRWSLWYLWPFTAFVIVGQLLPVKVPHRGEQEEITTSSTFAFALLLAAGLPAAVLALAVASLVADVWHRKPLWKAGFNIAQYTLSLGAGHLVLQAFEIFPRFPEGPVFQGGVLAAVLLAAAAYFVVNNTVTGVALALAQRLPIVSYLRSDLGLQAGTAAVLLALGPVVVVVAEQSLFMVALLGIPMAIVYKGARVWLEKESREHQATHDQLTGLPNRTLFYERVREEIDRDGDDGPFAVMLIDLDRFKEINDTLGHYAGDQLLRQIGPRMRSVLRDEDLIARLGGDEFAVLVPDIPGEHSALAVAERLQEALEVQFTIEGLSLDVDASIGIAIHPDHGVTLDDLMRRADVAMYMAKEGHTGYELYAPERDRHSLGRLTLLGELRRAIEKGELVLHYQPKADLKTGRVVAAEALVRWDHPRHGMMGPDKFVPLAERTGMMRPLTLFVLNAALRQCREWHAVGQPIGVAVNLSARNLLDLRFPDEVQRLLTTWQVAPGWLELEITESAVMADPHRAMHVLARLSEMGIGVSLDDFGTGYSSLVYLKRLPVNEVKIDKSFITHMTDEENDAVIVESTIDLARSLGLRVVAEGVETEEVWRLLGQLGCDMAQGYYLSKPMSAIDLTNWLQGAQPGRYLRVAT